MQLKDVRDYTQFEEFYRSNNLITIEAKIARLKEEMGVEATIYEGKVDNTGLLSCLQQQALEAWDKISCLDSKKCQEAV